MDHFDFRLMSSPSSTSALEEHDEHEPYTPDQAVNDYRELLGLDSDTCEEPRTIADHPVLHAIRMELHAAAELYALREGTYLETDGLPMK